MESTGATGMVTSHVPLDVVAFMLKFPPVVLSEKRLTFALIGLCVKEGSRQSAFCVYANACQTYAFLVVIVKSVCASPSPALYRDMSASILASVVFKSREDIAVNEPVIEKLGLWRVAEV